MGRARPRVKMIQLRKEKGLTQAEVAKAIGISRQYYGMIEQGRRESPIAVAHRIAQFYGADIAELFLTPPRTHDVSEGHSSSHATKSA